LDSALDCGHRQHEVRGAFLERTAALSDIEGFRMISSRCGSYLQLCLKEESNSSKHIIAQS
jgi:hypothetical protein